MVVLKYRVSIFAVLRDDGADAFGCNVFGEIVAELQRDGVLEQLEADAFACVLLVYFLNGLDVRLRVR